MRRVYPSDLSREQYEVIRELLEGERKKAKPRQADLYEVFCVVLYVLKSGCQWRMLPSDFPNLRKFYFQTPSFCGGITKGQRYPVDDGCQTAMRG